MQRPDAYRRGADALRVIEEIDLVEHQDDGAWGGFAKPATSASARGDTSGRVGDVGNYVCIGQRDRAPSNASTAEAHTRLEESGVSKTIICASGVV